MSKRVEKIALQLSKYDKEELTIHSGLSVKQQLALWHAELCERHDIDCRYEWDECRDCYFCNITLPRLSLHHDYRVKPKEQEDFIYAFTYLNNHRIKEYGDFSSAISHLLMMMEAKGKEVGYSLCLLNKVVAHTLCDKNREVSYDVYKMEHERGISYEDVMMMINGVDPKVPHIIKDGDSLREYIRRQNKEICKNEKRYKEHYEGMFATLDTRVREFYQWRTGLYKSGLKKRIWNNVRKFIYGALVLLLCIFAMYMVYSTFGKGFWTFALLGGIIVGGFVLGVKILMMCSCSALEEYTLKRFPSWEYVYGQIDRKGQAELGYLVSSQTTNIHWLYAVAYSAVSSPIERSYVGLYIESKGESFSKIVIENERNYMGSNIEDIFK